jgi:chemotaxis protein MotB
MSAPGRRKKHHEEEHENHERWLVSYADFITVLMALFIVMFALSNADKDKFDAFASGMDELPGAGTSLLEGGALLVAPATSMGTPAQAASAALAEKQAQQAAAAQEVEDLVKAREAIDKALLEKGMAGAVRFRSTSAAWSSRSSPTMCSSTSAGPACARPAPRCWTPSRRP